MNKAEIASIIESHRLYLAGDPAGKRADLRGADLTGAYLTGAYLRGADLAGAYLARADLAGADLTGADLTGADLAGANLRGADLAGAYLAGANLTGANLYGANLAGADLTGADLREANLTRAKIEGARLPFEIVPEAGEFTAFKKLWGGAIATLRVSGRRLGGRIGRKCRGETATTMSIDGPGAEEGAEGYHRRGLIYRVGETVTVSDFDPDWTNDCSRGIHFFMTRKEAEEYSG